MTEIELIIKLRAHLEHMKNVLNGNTFRSYNSGVKFNALYDEVKLMLALIEGAGGK